MSFATEETVNASLLCCSYYFSYLDCAASLAAFFSLRLAFCCCFFSRMRSILSSGFFGAGFCSPSDLFVSGCPDAVLCCSVADDADLILLRSSDDLMGDVLCCSAVDDDADLLLLDSSAGGTVEDELFSSSLFGAALAVAAVDIFAFFTM